MENELERTNRLFEQLEREAYGNLKIPAELGDDTCEYCGEIINEYNDELIADDGESVCDLCYDNYNQNIEWDDENDDPDFSPINNSGDDSFDNTNKLYDMLYNNKGSLPPINIKPTDYTQALKNIKKRN